jgi:ATP-binding cassette subfamily B protein
VKVLARIYRPQQGIVTLDGKNVNDIQIKSWYKKLGVLFQDFNTYGNLTVSENVHIGRSDHERTDNEKVIQALKESNAYDFVKKYPKQLDQKLSERYKGGIRPSGGQWQKLAIARFFYRNAPILILDEPTAAIDAVSEAQIFDNIYKFMKGKTVIIISHRFSTVRNADRIIVLDKGKIIEDGSHEELLAKNGKYAKSFKIQAEGYK